MSFPEQNKGVDGQSAPSLPEQPKGGFSRGAIFAIIAAYTLLALMLLVGVLIVVTANF